MPHPPTTRNRARWLHGAPRRRRSSSPSPQPRAARRPSDLWSEVGFGVDERVYVAESLVAVLEKLVSRLSQERLHVAVERPLQRHRRGVAVPASAASLLRHHLFAPPHPQDSPR